MWSDLSVLRCCLTHHLYVFVSGMTVYFQVRIKFMLYSIGGHSTYQIHASSFTQSHYPTYFSVTNSLTHSHLPFSIRPLTQGSRYSSQLTQQPACLWDMGWEARLPKENPCSPRIRWTPHRQHWESELNPACWNSGMAALPAANTEVLPSKVILQLVGFSCACYVCPSSQ